MSSSLATTRREFLKLFGAAGVVAALPAAALAPILEAAPTVAAESRPALVGNVVLNALLNGEWKPVGVLSSFSAEQIQPVGFDWSQDGIKRFKPIYEPPTMSFEGTIVAPELAYLEAIHETRAERFALVTEWAEHEFITDRYRSELMISGALPEATIYIEGHSAVIKPIPEGQMKPIKGIVVRG